MGGGGGLVMTNLQLAESISAKIQNSVCSGGGGG